MDKETKLFARKVLLASVIVGSAYLIVSNFDIVLNVFSVAITSIYPVIVGLCIAFILNVPMSGLEKLIKKRKPDITDRWARRIAVLGTYLGALLLVTLLISIVIPQLWRSMIALAQNLPVYVKAVLDYANNLLEQMGMDFKLSLDGIFSVPIEELGTSLEKWISELTPTISKWIEKIDPSVVSDIGRSALSLLKIIVRFCLGLVFSIYVLLSKEKFKLQTGNILDALLPEAFVKNIRYLGRKTEQIFSDFISGQLVEMSILGTLFFILLSVSGMPYALLISVVIAMTSIIPYFGSTIALIFGSVLILAVSGLVRMIVFIAMFLITQQIDNNLIYPHVVGSSVGLPPVWVLVAVTFFGSAFGAIGLLVAVPTMALLYTLFSDFIQNRLDRKEAVKKRLAK